MNCPRCPPGSSASGQQEGRGSRRAASWSAAWLPSCSRGKSYKLDTSSLQEMLFSSNFDFLHFVFDFLPSFLTSFLRLWQLLSTVKLELFVYFRTFYLYNVEHSIYRPLNVLRSTFYYSSLFHLLSTFSRLPLLIVLLLLPGSFISSSSFIFLHFELIIN